MEAPPENDPLRLPVLPTPSPTPPSQRVADAAAFRSVPLNIDCAPKCAFCYEFRIPELFPWIETVLIPKYDEPQFQQFRDSVEWAKRWEQRHGRGEVFGHLAPLEKAPDGVKYYPTCDVFSTGMSHAQIEELVRLRRGGTFKLYTVGLDIDADFIAYLTRTYPETFRLHLSLITFDPSCRKGVMHPRIDMDELRRICGVVENATFFFIPFTEQQLVDDIEELESLTHEGSGHVYVHKLYYNRLSPKRVVNLARRAESELETALRALAARDNRLSISLSPGADIYAHTHRDSICSVFDACAGVAGEVVFCSAGAFDVVSAHLAASPVEVVAMKPEFGGNIDFVQGTTLRSVGEQIGEMKDAGLAVSSIYLPESMFWMEGTYDLRGETAETLSEQHPDVDITVLAVDQDVVLSVLSLEDCVAFYER